MQERQDKIACDLRRENEVVTSRLEAERQGYRAEKQMYQVEVHLSIYLPTYLSIYLSIHPLYASISIYLSIYQLYQLCAYTFLSIYVSIYP